MHRVSVCRHAVPYTPVDSLGRIARGPAYSSRSPVASDVGLPQDTDGSASTTSPFGASTGVHLRYGLLARGAAKRPFTSKASTASLPPPPLRLRPAGATKVAGRELHPLETYTFSRRTPSPFSLSVPFFPFVPSYVGYRRDHLPIGSGVTEAACKTVFTQRLKQSGMTWTVEGGQWIVDQREIHLSGVWSEVYQSYLGSKENDEMGTQGTTPKRKASKAA